MHGDVMDMQRHPAITRPGGRVVMLERKHGQSATDTIVVATKNKLAQARGKHVRF